MQGRHHPIKSQLDTVLRQNAHREQRPMVTSMRLCKQTDSSIILEASWLMKTAEPAGKKQKNNKPRSASTQGPVDVVGLL
jgi:hypothetical protein